MDRRHFEEVSTSTAAFLGEAERGSLTPRLVTSYEDYRRWFGDVFDPGKFLPHSVHGFFQNGGQRVYGCRLVGEGATPAAASFGNFLVRAAGPGLWGTRIFAKIEDGTTRTADGRSLGFRLRLAYWSAGATPFDPFPPDGRLTQPAPSHTEDFDDLVVDEGSPDFYGKRVPFVDLDNGEVNRDPETSALGMLVKKAGVPAGARPANGAQVLTDGSDGPAPLGIADYVGAALPGARAEQGLAALELDLYRDVALVYAPDVSADIARAIAIHCERLRFRFAVIDCPRGISNPSELAPRDQVADTTHAAFYYPWIAASDPSTGVRTLVPPGGHVLGAYARTDAERGVWKAPANEVLSGALDVEFAIDDSTQDALAPRGVNAIRQFPGRGIRVWGARTISSDVLWRYVNVRRLFIFIERSVYEGTRWVVFEPNDERLWIRVVDLIRVFLRAQWRAGALLGTTERDAFFVTCDRSTMTQDDILNGRLVCEIGIAPVRPAEFVIFRIFQSTAEAHA